MSNDDDKVKPIRKNIDIKSMTERQPAIKALVDHLEFLKKMAEDGDLREFAYVGINSDNTIYTSVIGKIQSSPHFMQAELFNLAFNYRDFVFLPVMEGSDNEEGY